MIEARYVELIKRLSGANLEWIEGTETDSYTTTVSNYHIEISEEDGPRSTIDIRVRVLNPEYIEIDSFVDTDIQNSYPGGAFATMSAIYKSARASARGTLKALDVIISGLPEAPAPAKTEESSSFEDEIPF
jgi:hypothetical protein